MADDLDFLPTASSIFTAAAEDLLQLGCSLSKWGQAAECRRYINVNQHKKPIFRLFNSIFNHNLMNF